MCSSVNLRGGCRGDPEGDGMERKRVVIHVNTILMYGILKK